MALEDELELDLEDENITRDKKRLETLSGKVKETAAERDQALADKQAAEEAKAIAEKKIEFLSGFSDTVTKFPAATEHKDAIEAKVLAGYTVEDAVVAVLNAENKLPMQVESAPPAGPAAGGSAPNTLNDTGTKPVAEMTQQERRALLEDFAKKGDISLT